MSDAGSGEPLVFRDDIFQLFSSEEKLPKVAGHS